MSLTSFAGPACQRRRDEQHQQEGERCGAEPADGASVQARHAHPYGRAYEHRAAALPVPCGACHRSMRPASRRIQRSDHSSVPVCRVVAVKSSCDPDLELPGAGELPVEGPVRFRRAYRRCARGAAARSSGPPLRRRRPSLVTRSDPATSPSNRRTVPTPCRPLPTGRTRSRASEVLVHRSDEQHALAEARHGAERLSSPMSTVVTGAVPAWSRRAAPQVGERPSEVGHVREEQRAIEERAVEHATATNHAGRQRQRCNLHGSARVAVAAPQLEPALVADGEEDHVRIDEEPRDQRPLAAGRRTSRPGTVPAGVPSLAPQPFDARRHRCGEVEGAGERREAAWRAAREDRRRTRGRVGAHESNRSTGSPPTTAAKAVAPTAAISSIHAFRRCCRRRPAAASLAGSVVRPELAQPACEQQPARARRQQAQVLVPSGKSATRRCRPSCRRCATARWCA